MSIAELSTARMTVEEFLDLPEDGIHRELIDGEVREFGMTVRGSVHSEVEANFVVELQNWLRTRPKPRGKISCGEVGFRLDGTKATIVGIDVAYASPEVVARKHPDRRTYDGVPILAVEILSPSDTHRGVMEMIALYLRYGAVVWIANPDLRTVSVHRPGHPPITFNESQELLGDPELPGFRVPISRLFDD